MREVADREWLRKGDQNGKPAYGLVQYFKSSEANSALSESDDVYAAKWAESSSMGYLNEIKKTHDECGNEIAFRYFKEDSVICDKQQNYKDEEETRVRNEQPKSMSRIKSITNYCRGKENTVREQVGSYKAPRDVESEIKLLKPILKQSTAGTSFQIYNQAPEEISFIDLDDD